MGAPSERPAWGAALKRGRRLCLRAVGIGAGFA
jgi:hypothetical protein